MKLIEENIAIKIEWKNLEKVFKLFCNSQNSKGKIDGRRLIQTEIEKNTTKTKKDISNITGKFEINQVEIEFSIYDKKLILRYIHPLKSRVLNEFIELLKEFKDEPGLLLYGIKKELSHYNAKELIKEDFFWSCTYELAPFGSDEGDLALEDFREWRKENPNEKLFIFVASYLTGGWEFILEDYTTKKVLNKELIKKHELDRNFDTHYNYFVLDTCIIATCFGQFIDEGKIDKEVIPILETSIQKLILWSEFSIEEWDYAKEYIQRLNVLKNVVNEIKKKTA